MRNNVRGFLKTALEVVPVLEPVVEIGSYQVPGQEAISDLRTLFVGKKYLGCDMRLGPGVDQIENVEKLSFASETIGTMVMLDTLEHVHDPIRALQEVHRVLKIGGVAFISSLMAGPIHAHPDDYWRYTPEAFRVLLKDFATKFVFYQGQADFPHTVLGIGVKIDRDQLPPNLEQNLSRLTIEELGFTITNHVGSKVVRSGVVSAEGGIYSIQGPGLVTASGYYFPFNIKSAFAIFAQVFKKR